MQLITRTICTWLCLLSTILVLGQGAYDLQFVVSTLDCVNDRLCIDIQIRAQDPTNEFLLTNQNYRFTFSSNLANPVIDTELTLSGFVIEMGIPSLWDPHDLTGSVGNLVSYNVQLAGGTGYPLNSTNWLSIGRVCFDIVSNTPEDCFQITWNEPALDFPPTVILGNDVLGLPIVPAYITSSSVGTTCDGSVCSLPPVAVNDTLSVVENNVLMGDVSPNDFEPDGETMTWSTTPVSGPSNGSILINPDGTFTYTPNPGFNGMDTVAYQVCDQTIPPFCDTALILITVLPCSNFAQINPTTALCAPQATFTATDVGMMATYDWDFGPLSTPGTASGIGPHNISFSSGGSQDITLTVTIGSCVDQITVPVDVVSNLMANPIIQDVTCQGFNDGQVDLNVSGGTGPYTFIWTNSATTEVITGLMPGGYNVIIRDLNNCFATASVSISDPPLFGSSIFSSQGVLCNGEASGIALATPNGGVSPYTFLWDNGETTAQATMLSGGFHSVTVTDANTCEVINTVNVTEAPVFSVTASVDQDVSCNGFLDGIATVNPSGGTGLFTFLWDNNETTAQATMLSGGLHVVTVTDENTCVQTTQVNLAEPTAILSGIFLVQDVQCNGEATGSATVSPSGGLGPYTFLWSSGETEATATQLSVGNQLITITDNLGCSTVETIVLSEPPTLQLTTSVDNDLLCFGDLDGAATAMPSGGTGAYTFLWDNSETDAQATMLSGGAHTITVTDAQACEVTGMVTIAEPPALGVTLNLVSEPACNGDDNGSVQAIPFGGTNPYTYLWDSGETTFLATGLDEGLTSFTLTDQNACVLVETITVTEPALLEANFIQANQVSCPGDNDGSIEFEILGGTAPFVFNWSGPSSGSNTLFVNGNAIANNLEAGDYGITIQDANNCTATLSMVTITEPAMIDVMLGSTVPVTCNTCNGVANINVMGGAIPYTFEWGNGNTNQNPDDLCAGLNVVSVTDNNGCLESFGFIINSATNLTIDNGIISDVSCNGGADGSITLEISEGIYPYTYQWSPNATETDSIADGLSAGTYFVTIFDNTGCAIANFYNVSEPTALDLNLAVLSNNDCPGDTDGSIDASVSGGTPPYTYQWDDASGQTTPNATGLAAGIYSVTITDNQACTITTTEEITSPTAFMTSTTVLNNVLCNGESTGQALVSITGGTPDYTYLWDSGEMTATASLLDAGTHFVTITDQLGCITIEQVDITEPLALALMVVEDQGLACAGDQNGIATVTPMGGTGLYTFEWDNGESTSTTTGLDGGIHVVTVTDENACIITGQVAISEPAPLDLQVGLDEGVSCNGFTDGQATATINGGNGTYTFLWDNGETEASATALSGGLHDVTVTDIQGCNTVETIDIPEPAALSGTFNLLQSVQCFGEMNGSVELTAGGGTNPYTFNWSNGETTAIATGLSAGINTVTLTDGNGCTLEDQFDVPAPADVLSLSLTALTAVNCFGEDDGSAIATVGGGTLPYTFLWDNGETDILATQLSAGPHDLTLTDANACATTANVLIDGPTAPISLQTTLISEITCFGFNNGQASVNANGGTPPFTYEWSNGNTNSIADDLSVGTQTITVTDANACTEIANVAINGPAELQIAVLAVENVSCRDFADGLIATQGLGGTEPYTYEWSNGLSDASINNLPEGNYSLSLTDNNGCFTSQDFTITQPNNPLNIELSDIIDILCFGDENGQATVTPNGGEAPYQYTWDSGETSQTASLLSAGRHTVTVIDDVGCTVVIDTVDIGGPAAPLTAQLSFEEPTCFGATDGLLRIENGAGGTGPYIYSLDGQLFGPDSLFAGLGSGTYRPVVQDANGCELQLDTFLTEPFEILVFVDPETSLISLGESVDLTSQVNTTAPVAYFWSPADGLSCVDCPAPNAMPLASTVYTLEVVDSSGCSASTEASIEVDINRGVYFPNAFSPNNDGVNDLFQVYGDNSVTIVRELRIFDRWGELLFTANDFQPDDPTFGWDGTMKGQELNPGVYVYFAEVEFIDGVVVPISGDVTLIR